jgi:hypothetical protein
MTDVELLLSHYGVDDAVCTAGVEVAGAVVGTPFTAVTVIFGEPDIYVPEICTAAEPPTSGWSAALTPASDEFLT